MTKTKAKKQSKKNPTDINLLAPSVVEAAIGEQLTSKKMKNSKSQRRDDR